MYKVITIGREFGSGGREFGKRLAAELGYAYYDAEIIKAIAERSDLAEEYVSQIVENHIVSYYPISVANTFTTITSDPVFDASKSVFAIQKEILVEAAEKSPCVIVGRCSDYILRDYNPLRIFIHADPAARVERCRSRLKEGEKMDDKTIEKNINSIDKSRAKYYRFYTGKDWGDRRNYDMCINTAKLGIKNAVNMVSAMIKAQAD